MPTRRQATCARRRSRSASPAAAREQTYRAFVIDGRDDWRCELVDSSSKIPNPKSQNPNPNQIPTDASTLRIGVWDLGLGIWDFSTPILQGVGPHEPAVRLRRDFSVREDGLTAPQRGAYRTSKRCADIRARLVSLLEVVLLQRE